MRGLSIVELMVAVALGLLIALACSTTLVSGQRSKQVTVSVNDINLTAAFVATTLDQMLRSAGSGFAKRGTDVFGCQVVAARNATTILPRASAWPAPFASLPTTRRLAPLVIHAGASAGGSDVLAIMTGNSGASEAPVLVMPASATGTSVRLRNTLGLAGGDLALVAETGTGCILEQVSAGFTGGTAQTVTFDGTYAASTVGGVSLASLGQTATTLLIPLGNATAVNRPLFQFIGVDANQTLFAYDLLQLGVEDAASPLAEGVVELRALYGVDTNGDGTLDAWRDPSASPWTAAALTDGSSTATANLSTIVAVRVGLVLRSPLTERSSVAPATLTLFPDLPATVQRTYTITTALRTQRHRTLEVSVPLRNML